MIVLIDKFVEKYFISIKNGTRYMMKQKSERKEHKSIGARQPNVFIDIFFFNIYTEPSSPAPPMV